MFKKANIDNKIIDVITIDEFAKNPSMYPNEITGILTDGYILPMRASRNDDRPGIFMTPCCGFINPPVVEADKEKYSEEKLIDFDNARTMQEVIEKQNQFKAAERTILTTIDNVYVPEIGPNDSPEMIGLKEAIIEKKIDIDKYEPRFGPNFNNDKRLLRRDSITLSKFKSVTDALDMKVTMIIEDKTPGVPNPIGKSIIINLSGEREECDESEGNDSKL